MMKKIFLALMAIFVYGLQDVSAQDAPMKIVTNHPDFKIKIERCVASGNTVVLDMLFINQGVEDVDVCVLTHLEGANCEAYDNEGNSYYDSIFAYVKDKTNQYGNTYPFSLLPEIPMKVRMTIENFSETAESIARFKIRVDCNKWKLGKLKLVELRNIPITRD
jgi:hypothetical protein